MEEEHDGVRNFKGLSMSELDRGFLADCNLSALSVEGMLKPPKGIVVEYAELNPTLQSSFNQSSTVLSPLNIPTKAALLSPSINVSGTGITSLVEGKSSTPYEKMTFQKPVVASTLDLSCIDLTTSHPLWEVSLIKPSVESPKLCLDSSKMSLWSPSYQSGPPTLAEISSLNWSGTPPPEGQRACREFMSQDSNLRHAVLDLTDEQQKCLSRNLAM
ncbi:uncharacterized protein si:ch73-303b9.1 [Trichomycterus rosablanca]|uniref:uncharacterized protein si:ch73-303b9.1 n=1 Tax=Trichomycterus rosablanca TaxID=2290929 RepID=UPI002F351039